MALLIAAGGHTGIVVSLGSGAGGTVFSGIFGAGRRCGFSCFPHSRLHLRARPGWCGRLGHWDCGSTFTRKGPVWTVAKADA